MYATFPTYPERPLRTESFVAKLNTVKENLFTIAGSPFYYIPKQKTLLKRLVNIPAGTEIRIIGHRKPESKFFMVNSVTRRYPI